MAFFSFRCEDGPEGFPYVLRENDEIIGWMKRKADSRLFEWTLIVREMVVRECSSKSLGFMIDYLQELTGTVADERPVPTGK